MPCYLTTELGFAGTLVMGWLAVGRYSRLLVFCLLLIRQGEHARTYTVFNLPYASLRLGSSPEQSANPWRLLVPLTDDDYQVHAGNLADRDRWYGTPMQTPSLRSLRAPVRDARIT